MCPFLVGVFVDWLYTRKLPAGDKQWAEKQYQPHEGANCHLALQIAIIKACVLADRILSPGFLRAVEYKLIDHFIVLETDASYTVIIYAFEHLRPASPVLRAMMDTYCNNFEEWMEEEYDEVNLRAQLPHAFLVGVMLRYSKLIKSKKEVWLDRCDYHGHTTESEKKECRKTAPDFFVIYATKSILTLPPSFAAPWVVTLPTTALAMTMTCLLRGIQSSTLRSTTLTGSEYMVVCLWARLRAHERAKLRNKQWHRSVRIKKSIALSVKVQ